MFKNTSNKKVIPNIMSFPKWTSMGRREATRPRYVKSPSRGVTLPSVVILRAPISFNIIMVRAMLSSRGGSMTRASKETGSPQSSSFVRKTACSRGQRNISGVTSSGRMLYTKSKVGTNVKITHYVFTCRSSNERPSCRPRLRADVPHDLFSGRSSSLAPTRSEKHQKFLNKTNKQDFSLWCVP